MGVGTVNRELLNAAISGTFKIDMRIAAYKAASFQFTHPGSGTVVFQVSSDTAPVNIVNQAQMDTIQWSDLRITLPDGTFSYVIDFSLPVWGTSPTTIPLECLNYEYMRILINGVGNFRITQHSNQLNYTHED